MEQGDGYEAEVPVGCDGCGTEHAGRVYETIVDGRLHWVLTYDCSTGTVEAMGWGRSPDEFRQAILEQGGEYRLRMPEGAGSRRVAVLKALRDGGLAWSDVKGGLDAIVAAGLVGTRAELDLLAGRIEAATSVRCSVVPTEDSVDSKDGSVDPTEDR
ncbi:hypothetical protein [Actinoplanes sp. NPDC089786]|uniref:hypothetical protein n=1 Tax=Actinoplanes sp. NPDC089786 TaxID=3155185 RepID=UPI0034285C3D